MKFFADTAEIADIKELATTGLLDGVTTNPSLIMKSGRDFIGRRALEALADKPLVKRLAGFTLADPKVVLVGRETILRNGKPVGYLTSGGYGYTLGQSIGYGYVRNPDGVSDDFLASGRYELVVASETYEARIGMKPFHDPDNRAVRA